MANEPLIEQLRAWADTLDECRPSIIVTVASEKIGVVVAGMRETADDLESGGLVTPATCPDCGSVLTSVTTQNGEDDGPPTYCEDCDREVATDAT